MTKKEIRAKITKLRKLLNAKPRGKAKGGKYERAVITMIVEAFEKRGITKDDLFRTPRGSKEGDIKCGSALTKMFPFTIEAKHYNSVPSLHMLRKYEDMEISWPWCKWWKQLEDECKLTKKSGILVFREDNGLDLVSIYRKDAAKWPKLEKQPRFITYKDGFEIWTFQLKKFLTILARSV